MTTIMQMENLQIDEIPAEDERPRKRGRPTKVEVEAREAAKKEAEEKEAARRNAEKVLGG